MRSRTACIVVFSLAALLQSPQVMSMDRDALGSPPAASKGGLKTSKDEAKRSACYSELLQVRKEIKKLKAIYKAALPFAKNNAHNARELSKAENELFRLKGREEDLKEDCG